MGLTRFTRRPESTSTFVATVGYFVSVFEMSRGPVQSTVTSQRTTSEELALRSKARKESLMNELELWL
jgi:hypothetical protein